ncbi:hypothetical protein FSP39_017039 [Pinctada imbricata]|uniref:Uncharacterized protein n=1 Tax=Pinctada imbricata TaxID=66713 RepID=A0AA88XKK6_PINIB|nr:hypothetical protein FSP39_017039 [Pinctada imbricata]
MSSCSFGESIGGGSIICGTNIKISSLVTIPLSECTKSVSTHLSYCHINHETIASEAELLLVRGGLYSSDISSLTVCPNHRHKLGNGWSCGKTCSLCSSKKSMPKGTITKDQSKYLFMTKDRYVGIGSGKTFECSDVSLIH